MAQQKTVSECKVPIKRIHNSICRMTGEEVDDQQTEIASTLPLTTLEPAFEVEEKLKCQEYLTGMKLFVSRKKVVSDSVEDVLRHMYTDDFLLLCNWGGRNGKQSLSQFSLASNILYDTFMLHGFTSFEKQMRKSIELSHHRSKQKQYRKRKADENSCSQVA
ncbi:uncharacterized protein LOC118736353 [Rhagoletis pomonella]|uniref:uncharacterized protein LOC118736353 n=1 Tax=Rhagoletis pomonella TaxID=28610 RepID=UPI00177D5C3A|nr:uncharacterized protein LOC118736353 [Rhagoletis pomonella]